MKSLLLFLKENLNSLQEIIEEGMLHIYFKHNKKYNFNLSSGGHAAERDTERGVTDYEVKQLMMEVWGKFKEAIDRGQILIDKKDSKKSGSTVAIHSSEQTKRGYLTMIVFPKKHHKNADYWDIELVTTWKGKKMESYKEKDKETGKTMYHPEYGQLQMWDRFAIDHYGQKDVLSVTV